MKYLYLIPKADALDAGVYNNIYLLHKIVTDIFDNGHVRFSTRFTPDYVQVYIDTEVSYKNMPEIGVLLKVDSVSGDSASGIVSFRTKYTADDVVARFTERMRQNGIAGTVHADDVCQLHFRGKRRDFNYTPAVALSISGLSSDALDKISDITLGVVNNDRNYLGLIGVFPDAMQLSQITDDKFVAKSSILHRK